MMEFFRSLFLSKKSLPVKLFSEGLRNENSGDFEKAIMNYQSALAHVNKSRFHDTDLKVKIIEKIKVLNSVTNFENGSRSK